MEEKSMKPEVSVEKKNPFDPMPDELLVLIFEKILDAKCLCICSSVCKRFAALVLHARFVFAKIPYFIDVCIPHPDLASGADNPVWRVRTTYTFIRYIPRFLLRPSVFLLSLASSMRSSLFSPGRNDCFSYHRTISIVTYLKKFSRVKSMTLQFPCRNLADGNTHPRFEPLLRWKFGSSGFIFVSAKNRVALTDEDAGARAQIATDLTFEEITAQIVLLRPHFRGSISRVAHILDIVSVTPSIKNVAAVDEMKQGIAEFDEEGIAILKGMSQLNPNGDAWLRLWRAPVVNLPLSGCSMEEVTLVIIRDVDSAGALGAELSFEEDEYRELATILLREEASADLVLSVQTTLGF